jgi:hypothetical protein
VERVMVTEPSTFFREEKYVQIHDVGVEIRVGADRFAGVKSVEIT